MTNTPEPGTTSKVIAFGDDRSPHADRAWLWINNQRWPGWSVDVITAYPDRSDVSTEDLPIRLRPWDPEIPRAAFAESGIVGVRHLRAPGDPRLVLSSCHDAGLVVVGPKGAHGVRNLLLGSTADHLCRQPPAPLVIATTPKPVVRALVCTDGSPSARRAVDVFASLPLAADCDEVVVLGVATVGIYDDRDQIAEGVDAAVKALAAFEPEGIRVEGDANVASTVLDQIYALRAQLVVLGTRGLSGWRRILLGATAYAIARTAPCSVLVVPEGAPAQDV